MNSENKEQTPKKTAQFVCDYRDERPTEFLPQLQMHLVKEQKEEPSSEPVDNTTPTIHVKLDDSNMIETDQEENETSEYPTLSEQEEPTSEIEGFPLWKRNNQPSRLFYPANPQIAQQQEDEMYGDETRQLKPKGIIPGIMILMAAFAGVVCFCMFGGVDLVQDTEQINAFLAPVMMQHPEPFSSLSQASGDMILQASVWRAVTQNQANYKETDEQGRMIVPAKDVETASGELFGSTYHFSTKQPQNASFFVYDEPSETYRVLPSSSVTSTVPQIKEVKKENGSIVVTVEFSSSKQGVAVETYRYILEFDSLSGEPYLSSIQSA